MSEEPAAAKPTIRITAICGSLNATSVTRQALVLALEGAKASGVEVKLLDLSTYQLDFIGQISAGNASVEAFQQEIADADGIILGTPEYHGSLSGALKTALDLLSAEHMAGKVVGLLGVAGGQTGAIQSLNAMRTICRNLHCWVLPEQVSVANSSSAFEQGGDDAIRRRLEKLGKQVAVFASFQQSIGDNEFLEKWKLLRSW